MRTKFLLLTLIFYAWLFNSKGQLVVSNTQTPAQLVQNVLLGTGVQVSNITYTGANNARGSFTCTGCGVGFSNGVLLTSGSVFFAPGPSIWSGGNKNTTAG